MALNNNVTTMSFIFTECIIVYLYCRRFILLESNGSALLTCICLKKTPTFFTTKMENKKIVFLD